MDFRFLHSAPRRLCLLSACTWSLSGPLLVAASYYVAPDGNDRNAGTVTAPFASIQRAQQSAAPGDTVWIRGGTYRMTEAQIADRKRIWAYVIELDRSGSPGKPISYLAYKDEHPVFDFSAVKPADLRVTAFHVTGSWLCFKGIEVTGVQVTILGHTQSICFDNQGSHNMYERLVMHDGQAIGFWLGRGSDNLVLNCDAYRNYDYTSENGKGGNVDGFGFHPPAGCVNNVFRGCRAWFNSDDGYDCISSGSSVTFDHCWAFCNGFNAEFRSLGDGNGFKAGGYGISPQAVFPNPVPRHVIRNCVAAHNKANGFYANHHPGGNDWYNNTAFRNRSNFDMLGRSADKTSDIPGSGHRLKNNLGYRGKNELSQINAAACEASHNSFDLPLRLTDRDFLGLDDTELMKPRKPDGGLPDISFMRPAPGSALIGAGVDVGLPFTGKAPDLGAFEAGKP